ncbi:MAG TPA: hypothetical protein PLS29_09955, partial [Acidimicrobiales bacterium]|nr:hypothetical protein [Acidimicrobiales bacterium]
MSAPSPLLTNYTPRRAERRTRGSWHIERRAQPLNLNLFRFSAVALGLVVSLALAPLFGSVPPHEMYSAMWSGTFGSATGMANVLTVAIP